MAVVFQPNVFQHNVFQTRLESGPVRFAAPMTMTPAIPRGMYGYQRRAGDPPRKRFRKL